MSRVSGLLLCVLFASAPLTSQAQTGERAACFTADPALARQVATYKADAPRCSAGQHGCGSNGGPGYRSYIDGQCVSWAELNKTCGPPPHNDCFAECLAPAGNCALPETLTAPLLAATTPRRTPDDWTLKPERRGSDE